MPPAVAANPPELALTIHFQGLCAFLRNDKALQNTTEVTVAFIAAERAPVAPALCAHTPVLVFLAEHFRSSTGQVTHTTALNPDATTRCPALGIWPLAGRDVRIVGAPAGKVSLASTFGSLADLDTLTGAGAASQDCLVAEPPLGRLVAGRFFLTSGLLSASATVGDNGDQVPNDQWVFATEAAAAVAGSPVSFAQEVQYDYYTNGATDSVLLSAVSMDGTVTEKLELAAGAKVAISQLCPTEVGPVDAERDFLAYYPLLAAAVPIPVIPRRLNPHLIRIGVSACPPATTFVGG